MKRFYKFLMPLVAIVAMALPVNVMAQSLTVADGTTTNTYVPIYGYYCDADQHNQVVYPASMLTDMTSSYITSMSFYQQQVASSSWNTTVTIKVMEITDSVLTDLVATTGATTVFTGTVNGTHVMETFVFTTPFEYQGGNLLVDITTTAATYSRNYWYGVTRTGASVYVYGEAPLSEIMDGDDGEVQNFLPKTTFSYNADGSFCYAPSGFTSAESNDILTFTWTDTNASAWEFVYGTTGFNPDTATNVEYPSSTTASLDLSSLAEGMYEAYVRADCGTSEYSTWVGPLSFNVGIVIMNMATSGTDTLSTCNATIYDNGGPTGSYSASCQSTLVITPNDPTKWVSVSGSSYTESTYDYLRIYDGVGTSGEELWTDYNVSALQNFGPFQSSAITVVFQSDISVQYDGFQINVSCVDAPACPRPVSLTATNATTDSIYLSISDPVNTEWIIIYGLAGFNPDTATVNVITTTDTDASIGELNANTAYDIYLMAVCSDGGNSLSRMITVRTACANITSASLPYIEDFETYGTGTTAFPTCWYKLGSTADRPYIYETTSYGHNNTHGLYFYASSSGGYCYAIMPPVEPDLDVNTLQVTFWARQYSTSYNCDFEVGVMTDPTDASTFTAIDRVHPAGTTYEEFEVPLNSYTGTGSYVAFRAVQHPGTSTSIYLMLDDVTLGLLPPCVTPSLSVSNVGVHDATVSWGDNSDYNEMNVYWGTDANFANATDSTIVSGENSYTITGLAANTTYYVWIKASCSDGDSRVVNATFTTQLSCYPVTGLSITPGPVSAMAAWTQSTSEWTDLTVEYKLASDTAWTSASTTNNYFPMTGLTPATEYNFRIIATCVEGTSVAATANFRTTNFGCLEADSANIVTDTIGNGTSTSNYFPSYSFYNYSLTQQIYLATDFTAVAGGQIEHIGIQMSAVPVARNIEIYMTNTSATNVSSAFIPIATSDLVWSGSTTGNITAGWNDITLTTPFNYTGGNILVTFRDMSGSYSSGNYGMVSTVTSGISRYAYQDGSSYSVTAPTGGTSSSSRLNMYFVGSTCLTPSTCAAPIVVANAAGTTAIDLNWAPGASETSWMVYQRLAGDTAYTLAATVNTTNYTATGLNPGLDYEFKVVAVCGNNDMAGFASASTECAPVAVPYTEDFQNAEYGEYSRNCWTVGSTYIGTNYPIPYVISLTGDENNKLCLIYSGGYMIMPEMDAPLNTLQARFTLVQGGDNVRLIIGLMSDPSASINNIVALDTLIRSDIDTSSSTVTITFPFDMLPAGTTGHITFWDAFADNYSFIDNLVIEPIPACTAVTDVTVTDVTTTGATVSWTASGSTATGYLVEYGPRNFVPGNGTVVNASTNSINLTGLNHSSDYDVYVYTVCSGLGDTSIASNRARFTTPCDVVTLPYFQNFDNCTDPGTTRSPLPNCWNYSMLSTGTYAGSSYTPAVYYTTTTGYTSSGDYCLWLYGTALTVLPEMPTTVDSLYISFHHYTTSPSSYRLIIGAVDSITPGFDSSFVGIDTLVFNNNENNVLRFLSPYTGTGRYIAFKNFYNNNSYDYSYHYIDDLEVGYMPSCVWPVDVHATGLTTTTAEFAWSICQATDYEYEYGPAGFTRGTGTTGTWSGAPYGISGLTLGTQYDIYVRGICGAGDTSNWSSVYTFGTLNADPATVPFYCDFTDTTLTNSGWEVVNGTQNNQWVVGAAESNGTPNALYISNDNGTSNSYTTSGISITYAYRDVILTDGQYTLSYDWKANGESTWDYIRAWLVPASQMPTAGLLPDGTTATSTFNSSGVAPAGWISIDGGAKLNLATSWQTHEEELNLTAGTYHLLFMWANDASGGSNPPAAIDNVTLALNVCPISDITFVNVSGSSAQVTWTGSSDGYEIEYGPAGFLRGSGTTINTTTNSATLNGLASLTTYDVYLRAFCNVTDTSRWYRASFTTEMCNNPEVVATGTDSTATGTSYYVPVNNFYNYTLSETIIDSAEIGGAMDITALAYYYTYSTPTTAKTDVTIWLQPTTKSSFSSTTDIEALDPTTAVMVYSGELNCSQGWNYFSLSTPYSYNGIGNLMVIVDDNSGDYDNSSSTFATVATTDYKTLVYYSDTYNPDINDLTSSYSGSTYRYQYRPYMQLINCGSATCLDPVITGNTVEETTASISWDATGASGYEVAIVEGAWVEPATGTPVTDTFYTFTGLTEQTNYTLAVRSACGNGNYSSWVILPITTLRHPCAVPTAVTVSNQSYDGATISWTLGEAEDQWQVHIFSTSPYYDSTYAVSATPSFEVSGLDDGVTYSVAVRAVCDPTWMSPWSDTVALTTVTCTQVTGVSASNVAATSATITWTATGVDSYIIEYGESGFTMGQGTTVTSTTNSVSITGLEEQTAYNVYVSGVCAEGVTSTYSERYTFTTPAGNGIDEVESGDVTLFPNPASTSVTIRGIEGDATVTVVDLNGRVNGEWKVADGEIRLDLTGYAKGAYFVRITGERTTAIRKLIVR